MTKQIEFNKEKSLNIILYILENLKRTDFHKIFKILYFSDRNHLAEYGTLITGDTYIAMDAGPVPSKIYDIFKIVRGDSYMTDDDLKNYFSVEEWMIIKAKKPSNLKQITPNEKEVIDYCIKVYGDLSYDEIKEKSHDLAWRSTAKDYQISIEHMALECGLNEDEIQYITSFVQLQNSMY